VIGTQSPHVGRRPRPSMRSKAPQRIFFVSDQTQGKGLGASDIPLSCKVNSGPARCPLVLPANSGLGREEGLQQEVKVPLDDLRHSNALCGIPFWEAKRGLQIEFVDCRLHMDVE